MLENNELLIQQAKEKYAETKKQMQGKNIDYDAWSKEMMWTYGYNENGDLVDKDGRVLTPEEAKKRIAGK